MPRWPDGVFVGFSWRSADSSKIEKASALLASAREKGGKTAVAWDKMQTLPDGFYLAWKRPVSYAAGYMWLSRILGDLVAEPCQTSNWNVQGHRKGFDHGAAVSPAPAGEAASANAASANAASASAASASALAPQTVPRRLRQKTKVVMSGAYVRTY